MAVKDQKALTLPHLSGVDPDGTPSSRDTCGWISGRPESALTCHPGQRCAVDSARSLVGCCWTPLDGACRLSTRCLEGGPRSDARDGGDAARTLDLVWSVLTADEGGIRTKGVKQGQASKIDRSENHRNKAKKLIKK